MSEALTPEVSARFEVDQYLFDCAEPIFGHRFTDYEKHALLHRFISLFKTIDDLRQRAERAEADRKLIGGYLEQVLGNMMQGTGHERDEWKKSAHPLLAAALGRAT